jgi:1-acyl-sn-glycerol-3-phosphate acyltransferase
MSFLDRLKHIRLFRSFIYGIVGLFTYPGLALFNKVVIEGSEHLEQLPKKNVLFVSNHQTYFGDVIAFVHIFCAVKWRKFNKLGIPYYLLNPFTNVYFVAAEETMNSNWLTRLFKLGGALTVKRTWRAEGKDVKRERDEVDTQKIDKALSNSWVNNKPIVVPVVINGFWRAFTKKGLTFKKVGTPLSIRFKAPLEIDYNAPVDTILAQVMEAIEQSKDFMLKGKHHALKEPAV